MGVRLQPVVYLLIRYWGSAPRCRAVRASVGRARVCDVIIYFVRFVAYRAPRKLLDGGWDALLIVASYTGAGMRVGNLPLALASRQDRPLIVENHHF